MGSGFYDEVKNDAIIKIIMIIIIFIIIVFFILILKKKPQIQMREKERKKERDRVCVYACEKKNTLAELSSIVIFVAQLN